MDKKEKQMGTFPLATFAPSNRARMRPERSGKCIKLTATGSR